VHDEKNGFSLISLNPGKLFGDIDAPLLCFKSLMFISPPMMKLVEMRFIRLSCFDEWWVLSFKGKVAVNLFYGEPLIMPVAASSTFSVKAVSCYSNNINIYL